MTGTDSLRHELYMNKLNDHESNDKKIKTITFKYIIQKKETSEEKLDGCIDSETLNLLIGNLGNL